MPILPLRDVVVFPHVLSPLFVGRARSIKAIQSAVKSGGNILLLTQTDATATEPNSTELFTVGTVARIKQQIKMPDGNIKILIEGLHRARVIDINSQGEFLTAECEELTEPVEVSPSLKALMRTVIQHFVLYLRATSKTSDQMSSLEEIRDPHKLVDILAAQIPLKTSDRRNLIELLEPSDRLERLATLILSEIEVIKLDRKIKGRVKEQIEKSQRDYYLNEQLQAIQKELGDDGDPRTEIGELEKRLLEKKMPEYARQKALKELKKLKLSGQHAAEGAIIRNYIDLIIDLPWDEISEDQADLKAAEKILNDDHYGLRDVKERILEFLAVRMRAPEHKSPIVCFVGPPGVGKTSLAQSIARSLGRKFERIALGGLRDEAELRGHRRTYISALPGRILSAIRKAGTSNPVILLDEIDKVGLDFRGDPASALLEILDPEQNKHFTDHYLDLEYDLSKVLFLATANMMDPISPPLRDRMEVIQLSGYTELEKVAIARDFVLPKERTNHGLNESDLKIEDSVLQKIIRNYTRESGVRQLQREISKICRKYVKEYSLKGHIEIDDTWIDRSLGAPRYRSTQTEKRDEIGLVTGLAWTPVGGEVLSVEASVLPGKGKFQITGQLGNVMQESSKAALSYVRSKAAAYGLDDHFFMSHDIHVHVPEGAIPKDGPSAGITMAVAILSAVLQVPVNHQVGMTGEITLRGRVLPIGGLKEKLLAAQRTGLTTVLVPLENERDLVDIDTCILEKLKVRLVSNMDEVVSWSLRIQDTSKRGASSAPIKERRKNIGGKDDARPLHN